MQCKWMQNVNVCDRDNDEQMEKNESEPEIVYVFVYIVYTMEHCQNGLCELVFRPLFFWQCAKQFIAAAESNTHTSEIERKRGW